MFQTRNKEVPVGRIAGRDGARPYVQVQAGTRLTCSKSSVRNSVASWALWREKNKSREEMGGLPPTSHPPLFEIPIGGWLAMAQTILSKATGRASPGEHQDQEKQLPIKLGFRSPHQASPHQIGLPAQST